MHDYFPSDNPETEGLVDVNGDLIPRLFDSEKSSIHKNICPCCVAVSNPQKRLRHTRCWYANAAHTETDTLVINIDGACRNNGTPRARASYGVYVGSGSQFNASGRLSRDLPQTSTRAEIEALWRALHVAQDITRRERSITRVRIACDSEYLVDAMVFRIWDWITNRGYTNSGRPVAHFGRLVDIHEKLDELKNDHGVKVKLWRLPREFNRDADALANRALD